MKNARHSRTRKSPRPSRGTNGRIIEDSRLAALCDVTEAMCSALELPGVLDRALDKTLGIAGVEAGAVYLLQDARLVLTAHRGISGASAEALRAFDLRGSRIGEVARTAQPWMADDLRALSFTPSVLREEGLRSSAALPLVVRQRVHGVLIVSSRTTRRFRAESLQLCFAIARQIGMAVENARLHETARQELTERRRTEEALRGSEHLYLTTIDALDEWLHLADCDLRVVYMNGALRNQCRLLGLEVDVVGKRIQEVFPFLPGEVLGEYRGVFDTGRPCNTRERITIGGQTFLTETRKIPVFESGRVVRVITVIRDVTEQRRAEEALRESEHLFHSTIDALDEWLHVVDRDHRYVYQNRAFRDLCARLGLDSNVIGKRIEEVVSFLPARVFEEMRHVFETGQPHSAIEATVIDGRTYHTEARKIPISEAGRVTRIITVIRDMTERVVAEEALRESELKYRTLFEAESDALFLIDNEEGRLLEMNSAAETLYGYSRDELLRMRNTDLSAQPDETRHAMRSGFTLVPIRYHRKKDGTIFTVEITARHVTWHGRPVHLAAIRDITARQRAETAMRDLTHRLLHAQEEERRRIARDLHDSTAQKLAGLIMALGRLDETTAGVDDTARKSIADCLATAEDCVQEIRSLSHLLHPPLLDELGLEVALDSYLQSLSKRSGIAVTLDVPPDLGRLSDDIELALFRIVQEGLGNVLRHAGSAEATVQLVRLRDRVLLEVRDRGRGIPADILERLRSRQPVTGMGIGGMRERLDPLGGQLEIDSSDKGTTIRAFVPISPEPA